MLSSLLILRNHSITPMNLVGIGIRAGICLIYQSSLRYVFFFIQIKNQNGDQLLSPRNLYVQLFVKIGPNICSEEKC